MNKTAKTGILFGASTGIGHACANYLVDSGHRVIGVARSAPEDARFESTQLDVTAEDAEQRVQDLLSKEDFDFVVFCVGQLLIDDLESFDLEKTRSLMDVNCLSVLPILRTFYQQDSRKKRSVVLISSMHARGRYDRFSYAVSKAALEGVMDSCISEFASKNISINAIRPGPIQTEKFKQLHPEDSDTYKSFVEAVPLKRLGKPEEIAEMVNLLVSDTGQYTTGQKITMSGGL